jgi:hypothetical protein
MPSVGPVVPMQYMLQSQLPTYTEPSLPMTGEAVTKSWVAIVQRVYTAGVWAREGVGRRRCSSRTIALAASMRMAFAS